MTLVRIAKNWTWPDLKRQTPGGRGEWEGIRFTEESVEVADYVVVLNRAPEPLEIQCPPEHIWAVMQEPPTEHFAPLHRGAACFERVYTQNPRLRERRYVYSQPALPWHVNRTYDELCEMPAPDKTHRLSWITSSISLLEGHRARLRFLERLHGEVEFDLYGRGFQPIKDKWDGLAPYRYSLAVENFRNPYYWTEKIADCFLSWTMPIYYGCTRIEAYFPAEAMIQIDIDDPDALQKIREVIQSDLWHERLDAIAEARDRVLNRYQLFPFLARQIRAYEAQSGRHSKRGQAVTIDGKRRLQDEVAVQGDRFARKVKRIPSRLTSLITGQGARHHD